MICDGRVADEESMRFPFLFVCKTQMVSYGTLYDAYSKAISPLY
jgi:hypothetical protein